MTDFFPETPGYVNEEHAQIMQEYFFSLLGVDSMEKANLIEVVKKAHEALIKKIKELTKEGSDLNSSNIVLQDDKVLEDVLKTYSDLIQRISSKYLTTEWISEEQQKIKIELFKEMKEMFKSFDQFKDHKNETLKNFTKELSILSSHGLKDTVTQQFKNLTTDIENLNSWPKNELNNLFRGISFDLARENRRIKEEELKKLEENPTEESKKKIEQLKGEISDLTNEELMKL